MQKIIIYSTPICPYCKLAKEFFKENNIEYTEIDVSNNQTAANEMIEKSGQMGVPVISIAGKEEEKVVVGFQREQLSKILKIS